MTWKMFAFGCVLDDNMIQEGKDMILKMLLGVNSVDCREALVVMHITS